MLRHLKSLGRISLMCALLLSLGTLTPVLADADSSDGEDPQPKQSRDPNLSFDPGPTDTVSGKAAAELARTMAAQHGEPMESLGQHLIFLGKVRGDTLAEISFYRALIKELSKSPTPGTLPALEAVLSHERYLSGGLRHGPLRDVLRNIRKSATPLWFELKWKNASVKTKVETVLYAVHPHPPVAPDYGTAVKRANVLEGAFRESFYALLRNPKMDFHMTPWAVGASTHATELLEQPSFSPTAHEIRAIFDDGGAYGHGVMLRYVLRQKKYDLVPDALSKWIEKHDHSPGKIRLILPDMRYFSGAPEATQHKVLPALIRVGRHAQGEIAAGRRRSEWPATLGMLHYVLLQMKTHVAVKRYFKNYLQARKVGAISSIGDVFRYSDQYAKSALDDDE